MSSARLFPPISALRAAEAAARLGSFTSAAEELHISQSAISQAIRQLEQQLGIMLFERGPGRIVPTADGAHYIAAIAPALEMIRAAGEALRPGIEERLTIGCVRSLLHNWLLPRLPAFAAIEPAVNVNIIGLGRDIGEARGCDIAIVLAEMDQPPAGATVFARENLVAVASPALASRLSIPLERSGNMAGVPLLGSCWDLWARAAGLQWGTRREGIQFRDVSAILEAVRAGQGVALTGTLLCRDDLASGVLVQVSDISVERQRAYWFRSGQKAGRAGAAFREWLQALVEAP